MTEAWLLPNAFTWAPLLQNNFMNRKFIYFINPISGTKGKVLMLEIIKKRTVKKNIPFETNQYSYLHDGLDSVLHRISFMYVPEKEDKGAALNFHLTAQEKKDVMESFNNSYNQASLKKILELLK